MRDKIKYNGFTIEKYQDDYEDPQIWEDYCADVF